MLVKDKTMDVVCVALRHVKRTQDKKTTQNILITDTKRIKSVVNEISRGMTKNTTTS